MNIKIISDGTSLGTKFVNGDTGEDLGLYVKDALWQLDAGATEARCRLIVMFTPMELVANCREYTIANGNREYTIETAEPVSDIARLEAAVLTLSELVNRLQGDLGRLERKMERTLEVNIVKGGTFFE